MPFLIGCSRRAAGWQQRGQATPRTAVRPRQFRYKSSGCRGRRGHVPPSGEFACLEVKAGLATVLTLAVRFVATEPNAMRHCPPISLGSGKLLAAMVGGYAAGRAEIAPAAGNSVIKMSGALHESGRRDRRRRRWRTMPVTRTSQLYGRRREELSLDKV
jgi:hypothetical protein